VQVDKVLFLLTLTRPPRLLLLMPLRHGPLLAPAQHLFHLHIALKHLLQLTILHSSSPAVLQSLQSPSISRLLAAKLVLLGVLTSLSHYLLKRLLQL
jgi:hypothetical protein